MPTEPIWLVCVLAGLFGLLIGSFLNVCIYRLPRDLSVVVPRSFCTECGAQIAWSDNVPVVSFFLLRAKCRECQQPIAIRYPIVEALTAVLFAVMPLRYGATPATVKWCLFEALLIALFFTDLEERILPDEFTIGGTTAGLFFAFVVHIPGVFSELLLASSRPMVQSIFEAVVAAIVLTVPIWLLSLFWARLRNRDVLGLGDVKLLPMLGVYLGLEHGIYALLIGSVAGVVIGGGYIYFSRKDAGNYELPLGSFFCLGAALLPLAARI